VRRLSLIVVFGLIVGCGATEETPDACLQGSAIYLTQDAEISDCLTENQSGGDLANVGAAMLKAAIRLNAEARAEPGAAANVQLGYLLGAAQQGAEDTEGIHDELLRRLSAAARYSPADRPLPPAFRRAYRRGYEAGLARG
jgi:hypothetical protein